ncbi:DNA primase [Aciduricibacillus chroicocephali]|uniref:DNA primase n=1 Tax=Aciduricibacillus chroicocephali TaxID=3054939 RepID=A0ABY9KST0_9BACI|nr:DNA primase [Bacillaceae bacterium 44XB]
MSHIPEEILEQVRSANDIVDIVGEHVHLKKQGRNYFGLCPFHQENSPSFSVSPEKQIFHCFGCGKGGNAATFLMELEGLGFIEAIEALAEKAGIALPEQASGNGPVLSDEDANMLSASSWVAKLYHHLLRHGKDGKEAHQYLLNRGLTEETIDKFQLGFAPLADDFTVSFLEKKGFHRQTLVKSGLITVSDDGKARDRFRGRVIFPIRNHLGKIVAFGGRTISGQDAKYLNSPESGLFQKSRLLFNFDLAKPHIRKTNEAVLCEGYMDAISCFEAGVGNAVATLGTALTEFQSKLLRRYADAVVICYDGDSAGQAATEKAGQLLEKAGCIVKTANLDEDMDPDSYIREHGAEAFRRKVIEAADSFAAFRLRHLKKGFNLHLESDRLQYVEAALKQIAGIERPVEREHYLKGISEEFDVSFETLNEELSSLLRNLSAQNMPVKTQSRSSESGFTPKQQRDRKLLKAFHNAERNLISCMIHDATVARRVQEELGAAFNIEAHQVLVTHLYAFHEKTENGNTGTFLEHLSDDKIKNLAAELAMDPYAQEVDEKAITDYIRLIRQEQGDMASIKELKQAQKLAEQQNDPLQAAQIAMQIIEKQKQLKHIQ